jgi:hypothetical protein
MIHSSIGRYVDNFKLPDPELANSSDNERGDVRQDRIERSHSGSVWRRICVKSRAP